MHSANALQKDSTKAQKIHGAGVGDDDDLSETPHSELDYDKKTVENILAAYGLSKGYPEKLTDDKIAPYFYPFQELNVNLLMKDNVEYFLAHKGDIRSRRFCFLFERGSQPTLALVVQVSGPNLNSATQLFSKLLASQHNTAHAIFNNPSYINLFKTLYAKTHCLLIGSEATTALTDELKTLITKAYANQIQLDCLALPTANRTVVLAENIRTMLYSGRTADVDCDKVYRMHQSQLFSLIFQKYSTHEQINRELTLVLKYAALANSRQILERKQKVSEKDRDAIEMLLTMDFESKKTIYKMQMLNNLKVIECLNREIIEDLIKLKDDPTLLLDKLIQIKNEQYGKMKAWEEKWKIHLKNQTWFTKLWHAIKNTLKFLYQNTLLSLGSELVLWIGEHLIGAAWRKGFFNTEGSQKRIEMGLKIAGAGLGLSYSYYLGQYPLIRMMAVNIAASKINEYQQWRRIDDKNGSIHDAYVSANALIRFTSLSAAFIETWYFRYQYRYLLNAAVGIIGSISAVQMAKTLDPSLNYKEGTGTKDQVFSLFFVSSAGQDLAYGITNFMINTWENVSNKLSMQDELLERFKNVTNMLDLKLTMPAITKNPIRWFNDDNPIELDWRDHQGFYYKMKCQAKALASNVGNLECEQPVRQNSRLAL